MNETAVIIGGSGGIGSACALEFAETHDLAFHYHTGQERAQTVCDDIDARGEVRPYRADITKPEEVDSMMDAIRSDIGEITTLVNAAGSFRRINLSDTTPAQIEHTMAVNFDGVVNCAKAVLREMRDSERETRIVHVSSMSGPQGSPTDPVYAGAKGAVISFTKSLARQYTADGVFSNVVAPATTETRLLDEYENQSIEEFPHNRLIQPGEVAEAVHFLGTTTSISGTVLEIDAGRQLTR